MKDILFINTPPVVLKRLFAESIMYANPPIGLGYLAAVLRQNGYSVDIYDMGPEKLTVDDIISSIKKENYQIIGIASIIANHGNSMRVAKKVREVFPEIKIVIGGPQATFIADEILNKGFVDVVVRFEGEETILELVSAIKNGKSLENVKGISYKKNGKIITAPQRPYIEDLDSLPFPAWDLFQLDAYVQPGLIITGRGCPYKCIFCSASSLSGARYRVRSGKNVVDEIEYLYNKYNINHFFFADDTFTSLKSHCFDVCDEIINRNLDIYWEAEVRANTVNNEIADKLAKAGCNHVQIGAESGDDQILSKIGKNITTQTIEDAVKLMLRKGISVVCSFILGHPHDTQTTVKKTLNFAKKIHRINPRLISCKFALLTPLPGTPIYNRREEFGVKLLENDWDLYTFFDPVIETENLSKEDLQSMYTQAWMEYVAVGEESL